MKWKIKEDRSRERQNQAVAFDNRRRGKERGIALRVTQGLNKRGVKAIENEMNEFEPFRSRLPVK